MNLNDLQMWHYFAIAGGAVLVLGIIAYFLPVGKIKLPAVVTAAFGGLAAGLALGVILMAGFGYKLSHEAPAVGSEDGPPANVPVMMGGGNGGKGPPLPTKGPGPGGPPAGPPAGPTGPTSREQLASLVAALDAVADRPVTIVLTPDERKMIVDQLKGLDQPTEIADEDAKARLDTILKVVDKDRTTLAAVGYPPAPAPKGGLPGAKDRPNPFKDGPAAERLKSLLDRLTKK